MAHRLFMTTRFGEMLARYRSKARLTQEELGGVLGCGKSHVSALERGDRRPPDESWAINAAKACGLPLEPLVDAMNHDAGEVTLMLWGLELDGGEAELQNRVAHALSREWSQMPMAKVRAIAKIVGVGK